MLRLFFFKESLKKGELSLEEAMTIVWIRKEGQSLVLREYISISCTVQVGFIAQNPFVAFLKREIKREFPGKNHFPF